MPTISMFYGIVILMHLTRKEHKPPHKHAIYGGYDASFLIETGELYEGKFPSKGQGLVKAFIEEYRDELIDMWDTECYRKLPPLD